MKAKTLRMFMMLMLGSLAILSSCQKEDVDTNPGGGNGGGGGAPADAPQAMLGRTANMEFTTANNGAPYTLEQKVNFTFASNGDLGIDVNPADNDGDEMTLPFDSKQGNEYIWTDANGGFVYALSLIDDTTVNEINLFDISNVFLGQFTPISTGQTGNLVANYQGAYVVSNVTKGSHSRMSLNIDTDGNIDFDSGVEFKESNYALVSDRLDCCNGIWVDMDPWPMESYPRVELYVDSISGDLNGMHYYPEYPSITDRVYLELTK